MACNLRRALLAGALAIGAGATVTHSTDPSTESPAIEPLWANDALPIVNPPNPQTSIVISLASYMTQDGQPVSAYQALKRALDACRAQKAAKLVIPTGRYIFDDPAIQQPNAAHVGVYGQSDLTVDGQGSEFVFHYPSNGFEITGCQRVVVSNLVVDWNIRLASAGVVQKESDGRTSIRILDDYPAGVGTRFEAVNLYDIENLKWKKAGVDKYGNPAGEVYHPTAVSLLRPQTFVSSDFGLFADGDTVLIRHYVYEASAFGVNQGCSDITLENVTVYSCPGVAFVFGAADRGFRLSACTLVQRPGAHRYLSATADASHFGGTRGDIIVENCDFSGQGDDSLNIHGNWLRIVNLLSPRMIVLGEARSGIPIGAILVSVGDTLRVCEPVNLTEYGRYHVTQVNHDASAATSTVTLDQDLPNVAASGDLAGNLDRSSSRYLVRGNCFHDHRARGMLIQAGTGLIENNRVKDVTYAGIHLTVDDRTFFEGFGCENVTLRGNSFEGCNYSGEIGPYGRHMACVNLVGDVSSGISNSPVHRNVLIQGNSIVDTPGLAILVASSKDVTVQGNVIKDANLRPFDLYHTGEGIDATAKGTIMVTRASNVTITGNCFDEMSSEKGIYVDGRNTSGIVVQDECQRMPVARPDPLPRQQPIMVPER